jgi:hypothetical protein
MKESTGSIKEDEDTDTAYLLLIAFMTPAAIYLGWKLGVLSGISNIILHIIRLLSMIGR